MSTPEAEQDEPITCPICDHVTHGQRCMGCGFDPAVDALPPATAQGETAKRWSWTECIAKAPMEIAELLNNREAQIALLKTENARLTAPDLSALWQPIETAPRDGTPILLWAKDLRSPGDQCVAVWERCDIEWWHVTDGKFGPWPLRGPSPTHWMPLPAPPRAEGQQ